jgi:RimJ/RimL family protein N-acetyltransferase
MRVRRASGDDWERLRDLRLRALADAPDAFLTTLEEACARTDDEWRAWAESTVVFVDDGFTGMAGGFVQADGTPMLIGMWVAPERRGSGLAEALAGAVVDWARGLGAPRIVLWVVIGNAPAERLYERVGFVRTGVEAEMRNGRDRELALDLRETQRAPWKAPFA